MFIIIMMVAQAFGSLLTMFDMQGELYFLPAIRLRAAE
jgi:hypothetical protein